MYGGERDPKLLCLWLKDKGACYLLHNTTAVTVTLGTEKRTHNLRKVAFRFSLTGVISLSSLPAHADSGKREETVCLDVGVAMDKSKPMLCHFHVLAQEMSH